MRSAIVNRKRVVLAVVLLLRPCVGLVKGRSSCLRRSQSAVSQRPRFVLSRRRISPGGFSDDDDDDDDEDEDLDEDVFGEDEAIVSDEDFEGETLKARAVKAWKTTPPLTQYYVGASLAMTIFFYLTNSNVWPETFHLDWKAVSRKMHFW